MRFTQDVRLNIARANKILTGCRGQVKLTKALPSGKLSLGGMVVICAIESLHSLQTECQYVSDYKKVLPQLGSLERNKFSILNKAPGRLLHSKVTIRLSTAHTQLVFLQVIFLHTGFYNKIYFQLTYRMSYSKR